jgi:hypothetical protein
VKEEEVSATFLVDGYDWLHRYQIVNGYFSNRIPLEFFFLFRCPTFTKAVPIFFHNMLKFVIVLS